MAEIKLLATDLDGTLIGSVSEFHRYPVYNEVIKELYSEHGTKWVACTGRSLTSFREFFSPMQMMGIAPDYLIVNHAFIYSRTRRGYLPHVTWNVRIRYLLWRNRLKVEDAIKDWHRMITGASLGVTTVSKTESRLCFRFESDEAAEAAANLLISRVDEVKHLRLFRYLREVDIRAVPYTKGLAVSELCRHINVAPENVLTIGDGHNDISMFEPYVAGMVGCPANAEPEVIETINKRKGHVSGQRALEGVLDVIQAYRTDSVCSDLPEGWISPSNMHSPVPLKKKGHHEDGSRQMVKVTLLVVGVIYVVLLVFARYGMFPLVIRNILLKPFGFLLAKVFLFLEKAGLF